jgi:hypothetical protein
MTRARPDNTSQIQAEVTTEEEYFLLSFLSVKMRYEESDPDFEHIEGLAAVLFDTCVKEKVPFHRWYVWIDQQMYKQYKKLNVLPPRELSLPFV